MNKKYLVIFLFMVLMLIPGKKAKADEYDNAAAYFNTYGADKDVPCRFNPQDGYIYFGSCGTASSSGTRYRTVGYRITLTVNGQTDCVEVLLGGTYVKDVSVVESGGNVYVLRRTRLSRLQSLFYGNTDITWNQIYLEKNTYRFDAIMTVAKGGVQLCGNVRESDDRRRITAEHPGSLYRTAGAIKQAEEWSSPGALDSFFAKKVVFPVVRYLEVNGIGVAAGDNIYFHDDRYYVRKDTVFTLDFSSYFRDGDAACGRYHPNYNMFHVSGWGDNQIYTVKQTKKAVVSDKQAMLMSDGNSGYKPLGLIGVSRTGTNNYVEGDYTFCSGLCFRMTAADTKTVAVKPEGRVYYNDYFPDSLDDYTDVCDKKTNPSGKVALVSEGSAPAISVQPRFIGMGFIDIPVMIEDYGSGISRVALIRNDNELIAEFSYGNYVTIVNSDKMFSLSVNNRYSYYICAYDNVGNVGYSNWFSVMTPVAYTIEASSSGGTNGYNPTSLSARVYGGTSEIYGFTIMSEGDENPSGSRIVLANMDIQSRNFPSGSYSYDYNIDPCQALMDYPDGRYHFSVISGGRYITSNPADVYVNKDTTKPVVRYTYSLMGSDAWLRSPPKITMKAEDSYSGIRKYKFTCNGKTINESVNAYAVKTVKSDVFTLKEEGSSTISVMAEDMAGNHNETTKTVKLDTRAPECVMPSSLYPISYETQWVNRNQLSDAMTVIDYTSGISSSSNGILLLEKTTTGYSQIKLEDVLCVARNSNNNVSVSFADKFLKSIGTSQKSYLLEVVDVAGNLLRKNLYLNVDCEAPLKASEDSVWDSRKLKGRIRVHDDHSGISTIELKRNDEQVKIWRDVHKKETGVDIDLSEYAGNTQQVCLVVTDMVGNQKDINLPVKGSELSITARIYRKDDPESLVFKAGEVGILDVCVGGYADKCAVYFPSSLLVYSHDMNITVKLTPSAQYKNKFEFVLPIYAKDGNYIVNVLAYKEKSQVLASPRFTIEGSIINEIRTRIR